MEKRIVVVIHPNERIVDIQTTGIIANREKYSSKEFSKKDERFKKRLEKIAGLVLSSYSSFSRHEMRIERLESFYWREILPSVIQLLEKRLKWEAGDYALYVNDTRQNKVVEYDDVGPVSSTYELMTLPDIGLPYLFQPEMPVPTYK